ncbi:DEAD/DEAH box helicase family protein [Shewanella baltica]|uniref:DEAD/DEAH box helicase n=1 Tax=Shewanella baltica TaxID=62322 RepID=UPI00217D7E81|nr:DEAD/DEAH box helicase family protein [Shewanella baltica]MCS6237111.1 DEAD/DEAH box helicase family protein [Shewanella baltica]MCS6272569.1 DEAD/DEAH box helicase family protein [Shewanella baltica]
MSYFIDTAANILGNNKLRTPQIEAYLNIQQFFIENPEGEALVVLPTGTGKSGLISIAPFSICNGRVLIITPGLVTKQSIRKTQELLEDNFWINYDVLFSAKDLPITCEYGADLSDEHLNQSQIVYSNIQKLGSIRESGLINRVKPNFFDMIIIDESHHAPADTWKEVLTYFSKAKKLHVTGTPFRGDKQELPGIKIHETHLSEVMRDRYVKWLRKETVNAHELYFTIPDSPGVIFTKEEVLELKDKEWLERSVALSEECSMDVINHSVTRLKELKQSSPQVPHKILAVGCSILHAEDLEKWYSSCNFRTIIIHSEMPRDDIDRAFKRIELHECDVVISVNMLMEGYDHRYLSILALFRPYRSTNAFAQVVGRVLRTIPDSEITAFEIDNNALIIYHEETGLDIMWLDFQGEIARGKKQRVKDYPDLDIEYNTKDKTLAGVTSDKSFISAQESYLNDINFNDLFEQKRIEIDAKVSKQIEAMKHFGEVEFDDDVLEIIKEQLIQKETHKVAKHDIDPNLIAKRPHVARQQMRDILKKKSQDEAANLLTDYNLSEKGIELAPKFVGRIRNIQASTANDAVLVMFINAKLFAKHGAVADRDNSSLMQSIKDIDVIIAELRRML